MVVTGNSQVMTDTSHSKFSEQFDTETLDGEMHVPWMKVLYRLSICGMHIWQHKDLQLKLDWKSICLDAKFCK